MTTTNDGFVFRYRALEIDIPQSIGLFGGLGVAAALEIIDPLVALFIAAVPLVKMLDLPHSLTPVRFVSRVFQGASKPVGSDADGVVRVPDDDDHVNGSLPTTVDSRLPR